MLSANQFVHQGLEDVYFTGRSSVIPNNQWGRCNRLLLTIGAAVKPDDPKVPGSGFKHTGISYSLNVNGSNSITYHWRGGKPADIDYA